MPYQPRIVDSELAARLAVSGAIVIEGPKACGKTATARRIASSEVLLDVDANARRAANIDPSLVLGGATPRLIDEWQIEPSIWNHVRRAIDDRGKPGQFILTGSAVPADDVTRHTGAGRLARLRMRPMTLTETGHSTASISLKALLNGGEPKSPDPGHTVTTLAERVVAGGWPANASLTVNQAGRAVRDYLEEIRRVDINRVDQVSRDPEKVGRLFRSLARNVATSAAVSTLVADTVDDVAIHGDTVRDYLVALERLMIVEDQPAWAPHLRSRSHLRTASKRHFVDPSLAVAAMGANVDRLLADLEWFGCLYESLVIRDLRVYAQANDATIYHYRDNTNLEIDAVVQVADGRWAAFEVKLGQGQIDVAAENLKKFADRIDTTRSGKPMTLGIIVSSGYGYKRDDGIAVIPIGALSP